MTTTEPDLDVRGPSRVEVAGIALDPLTETQVLDAVSRAWSEGRGGSIATVNVDIARLAHREAASAELIASSTIVVADGAPVVWAAKAQGTPVPERVAGADLVHSLVALAASERRRVQLIGGPDGIPEAAAEVFVAAHPDLVVVDATSPPFGFEDDPDEVRRLTDSVAHHRADLVLVGLGHPKQERLIAQLRAVHPDGWYLGCGGGLAMAAGHVSRAPSRMQRLGLEWVHRLALEPRRLGGRYLRDDLPFALGMLSGSIRSRVRVARVPAAP